MYDIASLNRHFGLGNKILFTNGPGGLPLAQVRSSEGVAGVALQGAHVTGFKPTGAEQVLFVSRQAVYQPGKAIRGGIPLCWPWFGANPSDPAKPAHGFARTAPWTPAGAWVEMDGRITLQLALHESEATLALWPYPFQLNCNITVGHTLTVALTAVNVGQETITVGGALHTYFKIADIDKVAVEGLNNSTYIDSLDNRTLHQQKGEVRFRGEVDRIYLNPPGELSIWDDRWKRRITLSSSGSRTAVVWNPWLEKARRFSDMVAEEYRQMVCVETANAADDTITLPPGGRHTLAVEIEVSHADGRA